MSGRGNLVMWLGILLVLLNAIVSGELKRIKSTIQNDWVVGGGADFGPVKSTNTVQQSGPVVVAKPLVQSA